MTCGITANGCFNLDYVELNMGYTNALYMRATADRISALIYAIPLGLLAAAELVKNAAFLIYNAAVFVINGVCWLSSKAVEVVRSFFGCGTTSVQTIGIHPAQGMQTIGIHPAQGMQTIGTQFTVDDLITFRSALRSATSSENPAQLYLEHLVYNLWFNQFTETVNVQDMNQPGNPLLSLQIAEGGQITSIKVDGVDQASFPAAFEASMYPCFMKALEVSSHYIKEGNSIDIRLIRRSLREIPEYHLDELGKQLDLGDERPGIRVEFLTDSLQRDDGIDAGGLRRDYFDDLMKSLILNKGELRFIVVPGTTLHMPVTADSYQNHRLPNISQLERPLYQKLGTAMVLAHQTRLLVGRRFEEALFNAAFSLTPGEANTEFTNLPAATILKMSRAILQAREANTRVVDLLENNNLTAPQWEEVAVIASMSEGWPENFQFEAGNVEHQHQVLEGLRVVLFSEVGRFLAPIHAIAQGIKEATRRWRILEAINWRAFSDMIQGRADPAVIANSLQIDAGPLITAHIRRKVQWIREWLQDPTTSPDEIREFVKFATGSSSLADGDNIRVNAQPGEFIPAAVGHSCFRTIDLSPQFCTYGRHNDHNKENFILALRELSLTQAGNYFMG